MKKIHKVSLELLFMFSGIYFFTWVFLNQNSLSISGYYVISIIFIIFFAKALFPRLVYIIENYYYFFPLFPKQFKELEIDEMYLIKRIKKKSSIIEDEDNKELVIIDFVKYLSCVDNGDSFIVRSFSPLRIDCISKENSGERKIILYA